MEGEILLPEPKAVLDAQFRAVMTGRKPAMLDTHYTYECNLKSFDTKVGRLYFWDDNVMMFVEAGKMGSVLGYGIDFKPDSDYVLTVRDETGQVIHDVVTDGRESVEQAGSIVAGPEGSLEYRSVLDALMERAQVKSQQELLDILQELKHG